MKKTTFSLSIFTVTIVLLMASCTSPISLTSWKNPDDNFQVSKVAILPLFGKLEYVKPFEQAMGNYFSQQGLKNISSLDFLNPSRSYTVDQLRRKIDSLGADGVLIFQYKGTDKAANYVPATYYGGFGGFYGWGGFYGGGMVSGGYWTTTSTVNIRAMLYNVKNTSGAVWTADITVTDPQYVDESAEQLAGKIYADWINYHLIKAVAVK